MTIRVQSSECGVQEERQCKGANRSGAPVEKRKGGGKKRITEYGVLIAESRAGSMTGSMVESRAEPAKLS